MLRAFLLTTYALVIARRWADLGQFFALVRDLLTAPEIVLRAGTPTDKEA